MATYIVLGQFTDQGIRNIKKTTSRASDLRTMAGNLGVTVKETYWTLGQYDLAFVVDAQDDAAVNAVLVSVGALGNIRTQTLRAFSSGEMDQILAKMP